MKNMKREGRGGAYNTDNHSGQALIIVLSLMAALALLAIAFSKSMRHERLSARNYSDQVRAKHFIHVGLSVALTEIGTNMLGSCYPDFGNAHPDAFGSISTNASTNLFTGQALNEIPRALWADTSAATSSWLYIKGTNQFDGITMTNGRVAYLVVNCSGLLDANYLGDPPLLNSPEIIDGTDFLDHRANFYRFETLQEIYSAPNSGIDDPVTNLFFYSYDPDRDKYFKDEEVDYLGTRSITLTDKFYINDITKTNYLQKLTNLIVTATATNTHWSSIFFREQSTNIAWNIKNYIDTDSIPQTGSATPWLDDIGSEATPLINEIVLTETNTFTNAYRLDIELWYPFVPDSIDTNDGYTCEIAIFTNINSLTGIGSSTNSITNTAYNAHSATSINIGPMAFGGTGEFFVCSSPVFHLTNSITGTPIQVIARILKHGQIVDQAIGEDPFELTNTVSYSVNDPRLNSDTNYWEIMITSTLGQMNSNCDPWADGGHGLPIYHRNGPMESIGEIGHIHIPDPSNSWHNISLTNYYGGAAFINWMTVRGINESARGLVHISTRQEDVLHALFYNTEIGHTSTVYSINRYLAPGETNILVNAITNSYNSINTREVFYDIGTNTAFKTWKPYTTNRTGDLKEDALRSIVELITFRQNIFTIIIAAQALSPDGNQVLAEKRAVAVVFRDSYTGQSFIRSFRWLSN